MKKFIIYVALLAFVAMPVSAAVQKATLINYFNEKVVVEVGSEQAQHYFGLGYKLWVKESIAQPEVGSVARTGEYKATSTASWTAGVHKMLQSSYGTQNAVLGSVVVASSAPAIANKWVKLWNATTTATDLASSTITRFPPNLAAGTYTFDISLNRGLVVDLPAAFQGDWVITFR